MRAAARQHPLPGFHVRAAAPDDLDALMALEETVFATDRMSRRSLRRLLSSPTAAVLVATYRGALAGSAVVLFRPSSMVARLYSIAVCPRDAGQGVGPALLASAEDAALARQCQVLRLEVHEKNQRAIVRYRKAGFREFGRHPAYYEDNGDALRFEKRLAPLRVLPAKGRRA